MRGVYLCCLLLTLCGARLACAAVRHVPEEYATIQAAIDSAVNGDTVLVAPGDYDGGINFAGKGIYLKSAAGPSQTTLRRSEGGQVVFLYTDDHDASIEGFTIAANTAGTGWAIKVYLSHARIVGNVFTGQWEFGDYPAVAIDLLEAASPVIEGNTFGFNRCALAPGSPAGSVIRATAGSSAQVINNVFGRTQCRAIAAEFTSTSTFTIINNTFSDNAVGVALTYSSFTDASDVVIRNNIIAHSATALTAESTAGTTLSLQPSIDHNLFFDNFAIVTGLSDPTAGNANVIADPKFVQMPDILRLDIGSPAISAGSADAAPTLDIVGTARSPSAVDIGAYEWVAGPGIPVFGERTPTLTESSGDYQFSILRREGDSGVLNLLVEAAAGSATGGT
ncbi:MAG: right-handed parallel beta-helix repeat-containing protein, partial [Gammaproteobacteria bacterium]|nr:right-handed parallel beta-helix repeat-containing protein [Gammaproteobacteria bacterium]